MKKRISKILGIVITVTVLAGMLVIATPAPVAASGELQFGGESIPYIFGTRDFVTIGKVDPTFPFYVTKIGQDMDDIATNGDTIYAVTGDVYKDIDSPFQDEVALLKSVDGGTAWTDLSNTTDFPTTKAIKLVAVAPDDPNVVMIVDEDNVTYYSEDGGEKWYDMETPATGATINDIAISAMSGGYYYFAAGGTDNTSTAELYTLELSRFGGGWEAQYETTEGAASGEDVIGAVAISPNFQIDRIVGVISYDGTTDNVSFQCYHFEEDLEAWNEQIDGFKDKDTSNNYIWDEGLVISSKGYSSFASAALEFTTLYDGTDSAERNAFATFADASGAGEIKTIKNVKVTPVTNFNDTDLGAAYSLAYHEEGKLLIGDYGSNTVYICLDPLAKEPACERTYEYKQPGGTSKVSVDWSGDTAVAVTQGNESCLAVSDDDAYSFTDVSLLNVSTTYFTDFAVSADAGMSYAASYDSDNDVSIWAKNGMMYSRVLSLKGVASGDEDIAIRMAPDNTDVVYLSIRGTKTMYISRNAGMNSWKKVTCKLAVDDFAVESADVLYAISGSSFTESINGGLSWSPTVGFEGKTLYNITIAPNNDVMIGGASYILYSDDGGTTFKETSGGSGGLFTPDTNYGDNGIVYYESRGSIYRKSVTGPPTTISIEDIEGNGVPSGWVYVDIKMAGDTLYVLTNTDNGSESRLYRALEPRTAINEQTAIWGYVKTNAVTPVPGAYYLGDSCLGPQPLKIARDYEERGVGAMPKLYGIETGGDDSVRAFEDALATFSPDLGIPVDNEEVPVNSLSGWAYDMTFTWERFSSTLISTCQFQIATDPEFNALLVTGAPINTANNLATGVVTGITTDIISVIAGPTGSVRSTFMPNNTYYWRLRSTDTDIGPLPSPWSDVRKFTVANEVKFAVASPAIGATGVSTTPTLSWNEYPGALHYVVELADGSIPEGITFTILDFSNTSDYPFFVIEEALKYSNPYYWRVRAALEGGEYSDWLTASFTTMAKPEAPQPPVVIEEAPDQPDIIVKPIVEVPETTEVIPSYLLWIIVAIGAILVIALIVLIVRTRRVV